MLTRRALTSLTSRGRVLHLIRHAQSNWNVKTQGEHVGAHPTIVDVDSRLSAVGIEQAAHLSLDSILPAPQLILSSPLSRALSTAIALSGGSGIEVRAEPLATEWCENSCDIGRPSNELRDEYGEAVTKLGYIGTQWWPLTQEEVANGGRESEASVDRRTAQLINKLMLLPHTSIALVSHCMILQKVQHSLEKCSKPPPFLANAEIRSVLLPDNTPRGVALKPFQMPNTGI